MKILLNCKEIHYSLLIYKGEDYPPLSFDCENAAFEISSNQILEIISKTSHAISNDETRLHLGGIFLHVVDNKLRAVATDGHRLSMLDSEVQLVDSEILENGIIIPSKAVTELKKLAESYLDEKIILNVDESFMYARVGDVYKLSMRLISREYPKYQKVIPNKRHYNLTVEKKNFIDAVKRIKIMSNEKSHGVKIFLEDNLMTLQAGHPSLGDALEKVPMNYQGSALEVGFNAKYLIETLNVMDEGEIHLELDNELKPIVLKSPSSPNFLGIVMPLKL